MLFIIDCVHTDITRLLCTHSVPQPQPQPHRDPGRTPGRRRQEGELGAGGLSPQGRGSTLASMAGKAQLAGAGGGYRLPRRSWSYLWTSFLMWSSFS